MKNRLTPTKIFGDAPIFENKGRYPNYAKIRMTKQPLIHSGGYIATGLKALYLQWLTGFKALYFLTILRRLKLIALL